MELIVIGLAVIPIGAIAGFILSWLTRLRVAVIAVVILALIGGTLILSAMVAVWPTSVEHLVLALTLALPLALGGALGVLFDLLRRRFVKKD